MSNSIHSSAPSSKPRHVRRFGWLIKLAHAVVIVLGIYSGYSLAVSHREAEKATEAVKPEVQTPARPVQMVSACEHGRIVRLALR
jgi:hypothetical protein